MIYTLCSSARTYPRHEILDYAEVDVGLEQRQAHLAHGGFNVGLSHAPAARQLAEDTSQAVGK